MRRENRPMKIKLTQLETRIAYYVIRKELSEAFHYTVDSPDTKRFKALLLDILSKLKMSTNNMDEHLENLYNNQHIISALIINGMDEVKTDEVTTEETPVEEVKEEETAE